jgi:phenylpropionate dioxygenase-like ring-hydroxylating dioxygenase large terminal subunit
VSGLPAVARDHWFPIALSKNVGARPLRVMFFGVPRVVARIGGAVTVLEDRCPHRGVPLSDGKVTRGGLECPYHGWTFARDGRCTLMPGAEGGTPLADVRVPSLEVREHDGLIWASAQGNRAFPDRVNAMDPRHRRFQWQTRWRAPVVDVLENFLDPLHTHSIHPGLVRRPDRRQPVLATLETHGDGFKVDYTGNPQQSGILFRLFESRRTVERAWLSALAVAQLEYRYVSGWSSYITLHCSPETETSTQVFATLHVEGRFAPAWLVRALVWPFLRRVAQQDQAVLERQQHARADFPGRREIVSPLDLVRPYVEAAWNGAPAPAPRREITLEL